MDSLDQWISVRNLMSDVRNESGIIRGTITVDPRVKNLLDVLPVTSVTVHKGGRILPPSQLKTGDKAEVSLERGAFNYYEKLNDFIEHFPSGEPQGRFHIFEISYSSDGVSIPLIFQHYRMAVRVWKLLSSIADHADDNRLFLLSSDKLEIVCSFEKDDLTDLEKLSSLEVDFAENTASQETKKILLKRSLFDGLRNCSPTKRFGSLLKNFDLIYDSYWQNFRLFLEGISFDKIFEGYVEKHSKIITELNSVLGGIQTALIGLPIASFVILEKMSVASHPTFKNTLLAIGCIVFVGFLGILSFSQGRTLDASKTLAKELNDEIAGKSPDLSKRLASSLGRLNRHATWVTRLLFTVRFLLVGLLLATAVTFVYVSFPKFRDCLDVMFFHEFIQILPVNSVHT